MGGRAIQKWVTAFQVLFLANNEGFQKRVGYNLKERLCESVTCLI